MKKQDGCSESERQILLQEIKRLETMLKLSLGMIEQVRRDLNLVIASDSFGPISNRPAGTYIKRIKTSIENFG